MERHIAQQLNLICLIKPESKLFLMTKQPQKQNGWSSKKIAADNYFFNRLWIPPSLCSGEAGLKQLHSFLRCNFIAEQSLALPLQ